MPANRLIHEKSPYLLQHAHNPVDWYPWGEEAFEKARVEGKPIFLSVGYSTCHWCHVMERESFENEQIAGILNRDFVPVKVDREERPDVDRLYMTFVQATTGGGGWPMSVWLTGDRKPFFGGTYFPPDGRWGKPGFGDLLTQIAKLWSGDRARILETSDSLLEELRRATQAESRSGPRLDSTVLENCFLQLRRSFDVKLGGFGGAPKFPRPVVLNFLLRYYSRTRNAEALEMVERTLRAMAQGGMNDQLGGGFHRYSVDQNWFVPHFEKMLYDQAQLAIAYLEAYQITRDEFYAGVARCIFDYVLRDLQNDQGGFYSAEDADSPLGPSNPHEKGEGAFYVWTQPEIDEVLDSTSSEWFCHHYGVEPGGNVRDDPHQEFVRKNILFEAHTLEETAARFGVPLGRLRESLAKSRDRLLNVRSGRPRPQLDDKILTCWNALMISAFARGGSILDEPRYIEAAQRAARFIVTHLYDPETGVLLRRYRDQQAAIPGFLDDYVFFAQALLDLYESNFDIGHLELARRLTETAIERFQDRANGGFFSTPEGDDSLLLRIKDDYDGAEPSANSVAALNLLRLAEMSKEGRFRNTAERLLEAFASRMSAAPTSLPQMLVAYEFSLSSPKQVVLVAGKPDEAWREMLRLVHGRFLPNKIVLAADSEEARMALSQYLPVIAEMRPIDGEATAYVCQDYTCQLPTTGLQKLAELLQ